MNRGQHFRNWHVGLFLATRSLVRGNIGTSVMTIFMMAMIFVNLIFLTSIINGLTATANSQIIDKLTGHILVEAPPGETYVQDANEVKAQLLLVDGVTAISQRTNFSAELEINGEQGSYRGVAIDPDEEASVTSIKEHIVAGRYLEPSDTDSIIIGNQVAGSENVEMYAYSLKGVNVGDTVTMRYAGGLEKDYKIVGIFDTDFVQSDNRFFVTNNEYFSLFPQYKKNASEYAIKIRQTSDLHVVAQQIKDLDLGVSVRTWEDTAGIVESFTSSFDIVNFIVSMVAIVVAGITIFIVMYIDVVNRRRQIGILRAIGISELSIGISYLIRALLYALLGVAIGIIIFKYAMVPFFINRPLHLPVGNVSLVIENSIMYTRSVALLLVSFLGAYIPIQKTLRMSIINAIWGE